MLKLTFIIILTLTTVSCSQKQKILVIGDNEIGIVGYGSLMSLASLESTLNRKYTGVSYKVHLIGYKRKWSYASKSEEPDQDGKKYFPCYVSGRDTIMIDKLISLNIIEDTDSKINAILYIIKESDLTLLDIRESGYQRISVADRLQEFQINGGDVFVYKAFPQFTKDNLDVNPIVNSIDSLYIEMVLSACDSIGSDFRREYDQSTIGVDSKIIKSIVWKEELP